MRFDRTAIDHLKEEGNQRFKEGDYTAAAASYSSALAHTEWPQDSAELRAILLTNRAACGLQTTPLESKSIEEDLKTAQIFDIYKMLAPQYGKAFFRSAQLHEKLGNVEKAFSEYKELLRLEPNNKVAAKEAQRLIEIVRKNQKDALSIQDARGLLDALSNSASDDAKKEEAMIKLFLSTKETPDQTTSVVLADGIELLYQFAVSTTTGDGDAKKKKIRIGAIKVLRFVSQTQGARFREKFSKEKLEGMMKMLSVNPDEDVDKPTINLLTDYVVAGTPSDPLKSQVVLKLFELVNGMKENHSMITFIINDIIKFPWSRQDVEQVINKYLGILIDKTDDRECRQMISVLLSRMMGVINEDIGTRLKISYGDIVANLLRDRQDVKKNVKGLAALTSIMLADADVGTEILLKEIQHVVECIDHLAQRADVSSDTEKETQVEEARSLASEVLAHASGNKKFQKVCEPRVMEELLSFLLSEKLETRAKVVAITSRLASGNSKMYDVIVAKDKGLKSLNEILRLLRTVSPLSSDDPTRLIVEQWTIEALSFLSLHGLVKEQLVSSSELLDKVIDLGKKGDKSLWYGILSIITNVTRFLAKDDEVAQLTDQLRQMADGNRELKQLQTDPLDKDEFVLARCKKLAEKGTVALLVQMVKEDVAQSQKAVGSRTFSMTENTKEAVATAFCAFATDQKARGKMVADGAVKALLTLIEHTKTEKVVYISAHALAKLAISIDPKIGFTEGIASRMISPLMLLLKKREEEGLEQFEALMGLTNLALFGEETSQLILKDHGYSTIEMYQFSSNIPIQRAASELLCNLTMYDEVAHAYRVDEKEEVPAHVERRLKIWAGLSLGDDHATRLAAAGALAILSADHLSCSSILRVIKHPDLVEIANDKDPNMQHRGAELLKNLIASDPEKVSPLLKKEGVDIVLKKLVKEKNPAVQEAAQTALSLLK
ncbi:hypothetical protein PROFUN_11565 [Planoprotostelium fungivorum]|uniref:UNC-45/Cro1/She4 central domain-containing protein n=1 Tax=Planoprotostelium fungivorum TaxID=1890364 RepID=A0A2P6N9J8_9EUKA|nr:hypothetical protein PROFUN_11565 [Planoprotostelium fungivorum]